MHSDLDPFTDARAAAAIANDVAREVLRHLEDRVPDGAPPNLGTLEPVTTSFPLHPLDTAVRDLAIGTLAASHAAAAAARTGAEVQARSASNAARTAARTLALADDVSNSQSLRSHALQRVRIAHAAASTAHAAAELLSTLSGEVDRRAEPIAFPASWRRLIELLSAAIHEVGPTHDEERLRLREAACAARDGADAARHAYERLGPLTAGFPAASRFARIAALAAAYAGCAALVPLRSGNPASAG